MHFYCAFAPLVIIGEFMSDKEKILIADDSAMNRAILKNALIKQYQHFLAMDNVELEFEAKTYKLPYNPYSVPLSLLFNNVGENGIFP